MKKNNIAIILARGGSKGIKNKNILKINKMPLIYWSIKSCQNNRLIKSVWVSSDSNKILDLSKKYGANIIKRPKKLSGDLSPSEEAWEHSIRFIKNKMIKVDTVIGIQPTSPIRSYKILNKAIIKFYKDKLDSMFTAKKILHNFVWKMEKGKFKANYNYRKRPMRQKLSEKYLENGSFYIFNAKNFLKYKCRLFGKIGCFAMNRIESFEIDNKDDLELFKNLKRYF